MAFLKNISSNQPDSELVAAYKQTQNLNVVGELFQRYMELVYGVCLKYLKQPENAQDSTIAVFEELSAKLLKHEVENFKAWLYTLTKNHCLMRLRSEKKQTVVKIDAELVQSEESVHLNGVLEKEESFKQLEYCLGQLGNEQRQVIELFYLEGKCYNEISETTGIEWSKVRSYIQNGRRNLKLCIEKQKAKSFA
ncbi:MAG TPA: sigma-70 family RNA polymerase sigma factor [Flavisolibacter sp.]|nr:sigma-70 family RNA polymerase sigma factor [Flavisolibacter sp.]